MNSQTIKLLYILLLISSQSACSTKSSLFSSEKDKSLKTNKNFLSSGSITLSFPIQHIPVGNPSDDFFSNTPPSDRHTERFARASSTTETTDKIKNPEMDTQSAPYLRYAPIAGFFPPIASFNPADNELWVELDTTSKELKVFKGKEQIKSIKGEGDVDLAPGQYPLQHKQKDPLWYAPDEYFEKRHLKVPPRGDNFRYRRGALGTYALYPTTTFPIHSGPLWSEEIGGFKIPEADLASIFLMINPGTPVVVK